jgi:hypothetical protein
MNRTAIEIAFLPLLALILFYVSNTLGEEVKIIHNKEKGLWEWESPKSFNLIKDLEIGKEEGDENEILGRIMDVAIDSKYNIYILDWGFTRVQKYDSSGIYLQTIGKKGEGPGELIYPTAITIDKYDNLYLADRNIIKIFDASGKYKDEFRHDIQGSFIRSLRFDKTTGWIYIASLDILEQKIIHAYGPDQKYLFSFCDSYAVGQDIDVRIEQAFAGGTIDIDDSGMIYFSQMTPYEIRIFSPLGELETIISRDNAFMHPPDIEKRDNGMKFTMPTTSASIVLLAGEKFINVVKKPPVPEPPAETIVDLFDSEGRLLFSQRIEKDMTIKCKDDAGRIYAVDQTEYPVVIRYRVSFK